MKFNENDELYVMGDVVDRGPDPIKALQYLMTLPNCVCIAGNHEWMALESLKLMLNEITEEFIQTLDENQVTILLDWLRNGGKTTMDQFCKLSIRGSRNCRFARGNYGLWFWNNILQQIFLDISPKTPYYKR